MIGQRGFKNAQLVHGDTPTKVKENVTRDWNQGQIDLIVATSAFGLGIDFPYVRAVVHVCIPESLDRFIKKLVVAAETAAHPFHCYCQLVGNLKMTGI